MTINSDRLSAESLIPRHVLSRIKDRASFEQHLARYTTMDNDDDLLHVTVTYLRNLERIDASASSPDRDLQLILVPELWERIRADTRDKLRRISTNLAEYHPNPTSIFRRILPQDKIFQLQEGADELRRLIKSAAHFDVSALVEQVRFTIAGSRAADRWPPDACVYDPGFVYRLVPAIAGRALNHASSGLLDMPGAPS